MRILVGTTLHLVFGPYVLPMRLLSEGIMQIIQYIALNITLMKGDQAA